VVGFRLCQWQQHTDRQIQDYYYYYYYYSNYYYHYDYYYYNNTTTMVGRQPNFLFGVLIVLTSTSSLLSTAQEILYNAIVYTVDERFPEADSIAIDEAGFIVGVGAFANLSDRFPTYQLTDLRGQLVLPGFQDAHLHAVEAGINSQLCYVGSEVTGEDSSVIEDIPLYFDEPDCADFGLFGGQGWVMGAGVDLAAIMEELKANETARYPITVLDESFPDTPVVILDQYGHGALANTAAMVAVGYDNGVDPRGGQILKDANGTLLGIVTENAQQKLHEAAFPPTDDNKELAYKSLLSALDTLKKNGVTTVSDAGGFWHQAQTESWERAEEEGYLTVRASNSLYVYPDEGLGTQLPSLIQRFSNDPDKLVRFNQAKIYVDGILSLATARLYEEYEFDPFQEYRTPLSSSDAEWTGFEYFGDNVTLNFMSQSLANAGFQLHYHVTGDAAAGLALSAIKSVQSNPEIEPHRLTHCYLIAEKDRPLFAELGVVADFQLAPSSVSEEYQQSMQDFLGNDRADTLLPAVEMYEAGATVTLSSDWDADELSPLLKMQTVLSRPTGRSFASLEEVIPMLTLNPAKLLQHDDKTGSITIGKYADLAVIDKDIFNLPVNEIATAEITRTYLQGKLIYNVKGGVGSPTTGLSSNGGSTTATITEGEAEVDMEEVEVEETDTEIDTGLNENVTVGKTDPTSGATTAETAASSSTQSTVSGANRRWASCFSILSFSIWLTL